jgi:hypothetical protein
MTDFGAEVSFVQASVRLQPHYGITVPPSAVRLRTLPHGAQRQAWASPPRTTPDAAQVITELAGCLIPLRAALTPTAREARPLPRHWKAVRLCAAWAVGQVRPRDGSSLGRVLAVGELWEQTARAAGLGPPPRVPGVGDGAPWIAEQFDRHFGGQGRYLVDVDHVSEYLAAAAPACAPCTTPAWLARQQARRKANQLDRVVRDLAAHVEPAVVTSAHARREGEPSATPVRDRERYLRARREQLDYAGALAAGLPMGSGLIANNILARACALDFILVVAPFFISCAIP